ncbi:MAG: hypothetical protein N2511_05100 [Thermodesulfovibrionales bacterium]|nr:hypothetical protein [Thermodesulfovibrionales bacterium]
MNEKLLHQIIVDHLKKKLSGEYKEIKVNSSGSPDLILSNHGFTVAYVQVETKSTITLERANLWEELAQSGIKLILMVPKDEKIRTTEILWNRALVDKVSVGTYEIIIKMP